MFSLILLVSVIPTVPSFACTPVAVRDGDGSIWCAEDPYIPFSEVSAREIDGNCSPDHPCPAADAAAPRPVPAITPARCSAAIFAEVSGLPPLRLIGPDSARGSGGAALACGA